MLAEYRLKQGELELERAKLKRLKTKPATTHRRRSTSSCTPTSSCPRTSPQALENGATGIGLFRSEFLFLNRDGLPTEDEQFEAYREVARGHGRQPVTIRTFDLGADKQKAGLDGLSRVAPNPALGLRAIRFCLAEPRLFLTQLRAILRASHYGKVRILIPMLASVGEIDQTLALIAQAKETLREQGVPFDADIKVGGMIEIPAAVLAISAVPRQARLPVDRHQRPDPVHAGDRPHRRRGVAPLRPAASGGAEADRDGDRAAPTGRGVPIAVCGEMAGERAADAAAARPRPAQLLDASGAPARRSSSGCSRPTCARSSAIVARMRRTDDPAKLSRAARQAQRLGPAATRSRSRRLARPARRSISLRAPMPCVVCRDHRRLPHAGRLARGRRRTRSVGAVVAAPRALRRAAAARLRPRRCRRTSSPTRPTARSTPTRSQRGAGLPRAQRVAPRRRLLRRRSRQRRLVGQHDRARASRSTPTASSSSASTTSAAASARPGPLSIESGDRQRRGAPTSRW